MHSAGKTGRALLRMGAAFFLLLLLSRLIPGADAAEYRITDGARVYTWSAATPVEALGKAGLKLEEGDRCEVSADGTKLAVIRAPRIRFVYHGEARELIWQAETVAGLLERLGLAPEEDELLSPEPETVLEPGMEVRLDRVTRERRSWTVALPCETLTCFSREQPPGTVIVPGRDGELLRSVEVTLVNGVETEELPLPDTLLTPPVTRIVAGGTGTPPREEAPVIEDGRITLPTGEVLTYTGTAAVRATAYTHTDDGCDMTTATGTLVHRGTVAVDPRYIPYGTRMFILAADGSYVYGIAQAEDCGGDIKGDRMDLYLPSYEECIQFGRKVCMVYFLG